jgi:C4-dicarboxylate transporter DctQ subunit
LAVPRGARRVMALLSAAAIVVGMLYSFLPTWDYIDWMKIRKTSTVRNPFTGSKIPMRDVFSVYAVFMVAVGTRYMWLFIDVFRNDPPKTELEVVVENLAKEDTKNGDAT